ncbi:hypothetical protein [Pseudosulfitobacter sp. DSM 107133]|uniref:hypothetical protein n=1 Tax=Pseudosulfitobacter sp. DSM 107133 TaxID=2883100 RepID=UPI001FADA99C|nr:hypothetical protein [Pseudosulfitobacter sp. DSM 107133]
MRRAGYCDVIVGANTAFDPLGPVTKHSLNAASLERCEALLHALPVGVLTFTTNVFEKSYANKANKLGILRVSHDGGH